MDFLNISYNGGKRYVTGSTLDEAFYRLIIGDVHSNTVVLTPDASHAQRRANAIDVRNAKDNWQPVFSNVKFNTHLHCDDAVVFTLVWGVISNRRMFISRKGYIGLGPSHLSSGDRVYILNGGTTPFALRRKPPPPPGQSLDSRCSFVGACYVHGIMDGEAVHSDDPREKVVLI